MTFTRNLLCATLALSPCVGCKSTPQVGQVAAACAAPAVEKIIISIVPQVVLALVSDNWINLLTQIVETLKTQGVQDALGVVNCAIAFIDGNLVSPSGGALPPQTLAIKAHATAWLAAHAKVVP